MREDYRNHGLRGRYIRGRPRFGEFTVSDEDNVGEYEKTGEWEGHDVVEWSGEEDSDEYWECDDCFSSREDGWYGV